ncbi:Transposase DDE domain protein [Limihaloglobus sulfuriphilus]|uniref:Transposase DDE domain protein n=1 Tax=Limihaloglobus sulfuriphilus TaxID=1851148 RepID=A0A1Q2MF28_9BACT|nr:transposase [Limihaloglobus sulfuriphilus]AQQ71303.1 Transposase DDE domain protein [Limihaloglobus sulfuriphilus]
MTAKRIDIEECQVQGLKYFKSISGILESLHQAGCERDRAGNRILHMDQYMSLILLYMFNPICTSLRSIQQASELKNVQKKLKCSRASLGSLSEAASVFDSSLMQEIVENLSQKLKPISSRSKLNDLSGILTAVDGTVIRGVSKMGWALWKPDDNEAAVKAHTHFDIEKHVPIKMTITDANGNEKEELSKELEPGRIYVKDRGYAKLELFQKVLDNNSSFVCRLRDNIAYDLIEEFSVPQGKIKRVRSLLKYNIFYYNELHVFLKSIITDYFYDRLGRRMTK